MANLKDVKRRIESTKKTSQITKAMYMVSNSKVRRSEKNNNKYQDYIKLFNDLVGVVINNVEGAKQSVYFQGNKEKSKKCFLLITSDKGLAGSFNSNVFKNFENHLEENKINKDDIIVVSIGKVGISYIELKGYNTIEDANILNRDEVVFNELMDTTLQLIDLYLKNEISEINIIYNHYINSISQSLIIQKLVPLDDVASTKDHISYIIEGNSRDLIHKIIPMYLQNVVYGTILDSKTCEHSSRMQAMKQATDNASEVIERFQILYNRARQEQITKELIDIIGGSNVVK